MGLGLAGGAGTRSIMTCLGGAGGPGTGRLNYFNKIKFKTYIKRIL